LGGLLSKLVADIHIWSAQGELRWTTSSDPENLRSLTALFAPYIAQARSGQHPSFTFDQHGQPLEAQFAPLHAPDGQPAEVAAVIVDTSAQQQTEHTLRHRLAFQDIITRLSTHFASLPAARVDDELQQALEELGHFTQVDRVYIFRFNADGTAMDNTHEWCAEGIEPQIENLQGLTLESLPWWSARLRNREIINVPDICALPEEAGAEREILAAQDIQSVLVLPMIDESAVVGFIGFDSVRRSKLWPEEDVVLLRIAGEIFVRALQRAIAERDRRRLEAQLVQARSMESLARLAGGVAHDFNNLLAIILNYAKILERELTQQDQRTMARELFATAKRAADLTRQLLLMGRRDVVTPIVLNLNQVIQSLEHLLLQMLGERVELQLVLARDLAPTKVGIPQIEQVLINLAINARDAMPQGGVLTIATSNETIDQAYAFRYIDVNQGDYVRLQVSDTGVGMTPEVANRAFEPFFSTKGDAGTGLGLSTVHGIVKQAGGHIELNSRPGRGTIIDVYLPATTGAVEPLPAPQPEQDPAEQELYRGHGELILVVEDAAPLRRLVCRMLEKAGYRVAEATSADHAIVLVEQHAVSPDLLLTDVIMPQISGPDLALRLMSHGLARVLYMSGYEAAMVALRGVLQDDQHFLQKPFLEDELLRAVKLALTDTPECSSSTSLPTTH